MREGTVTGDEPTGLTVPCPAHHRVQLLLKVEVEESRPLCGAVPWANPHVAKQ